MEKELKQLLHDDPHVKSVPKSGRHVFLDSEDLHNLEDLQTNVQNSDNLVLLLTPEVLSRAWVLLEIVTAVRAGVHIVPVEIERPGRLFAFPDDEFYANLSNNTGLPSDTRAMLEAHGITLSEVEQSLKQVFNRIAVHFSPQRSNCIRQAELKDLIKHCKIGGVSCAPDPVLHMCEL